MCTSPKIVTCFGKNKEGKYITSFESWTPELEKYLLESKAKFYKVGCGKCLECRMLYAKKWANRLELQRKVSSSAYFLTLTYDEDHVPLNHNLCKSDVQKFLKRLRYYCGDNMNIKYFCCGEYGSHTYRPHYHMILFNLPFDDFTEWFPYEKNGKLLKKHIYSSNGNLLYFSPILEKIWGRGYVQSDLACLANMQYVARYVLKKQFCNEWYDKVGLVAPFLLMSQGLAKDYYDLFKHDIYLDDSIYIVRNGEARAYKPPRYFDNLFQLEQPDKMDFIKLKREKAILFDTIGNLEKSNNQLVSEVKSGECCKIRLNKKIKRDF